MIDYELLKNSERKTNSGQSKFYQKQKTLLGISSLFLDDDLDRIDYSVNESFGLINAIIKSERIQVHVFDRMSNCCKLSYQYCIDHTPKVNFTPIPLKLIEELIDSLVVDKHIFILSSSDLLTSKVKENLFTQNTKSILLIPMRVREENIGFISFDNVNSYKEDYQSEIVSFLNIYTNMLANLMVRSKDRERLKELIEQITFQSKQNKDFSFITSHNIRASVANLIAISDLVDQEYSKKYIEMLKITVGKLNSSLKQVNDILHLEQKELFPKSNYKMRDSVDLILDEFNKVITERNIEVELFIPETLSFKTISSYLDNIIFEVIKNAIQYGTNEDARKIVFKCKKVDELVKITIKDFGNGFNLEKHEDQLFKVGSRFHKDNCQGQGLGLYIVKKQIESLKGRIAIRSKVGEGTEVHLIIPIR